MSVYPFINSSNKLLGKFVDFGDLELPLAIIFPNFLKKFLNKNRLIYTKWDKITIYN